MMKILKEAWIQKDKGPRYVCTSCDFRLPFFPPSQPWDWFNTGFETQTLFGYPSMIGTINDVTSPNRGCFLNINWGTWFSKATDLYLNFLQEFSSNKRSNVATERGILGVVIFLLRLYPQVLQTPFKQRLKWGRIEPSEVGVWAMKYKYHKMLFLFRKWGRFKSYKFLF